jgi:hypothetical protein
MRYTQIILLLLTVAAGANAAELGRLFYTPQQRAQLEAPKQATQNDAEGKNEPATNSIVVNGVIQKQDGSRIVWLNGTQQPASRGNEKSPSTVPVTVPGRSQTVQVKVGQRLILNTPVARDTGEKKPDASVPPKPAVEDDD